MLVGHVGAAMALNRLDRRINLGVMVLAATFMDALLWVWVGLGRERIIVPADYVHKHYLTFDFPYSHSLLSALIVAACISVVAWFLLRRFTKAGRSAGMLVGAAYFSHWALDAIVHVSGLPVASDSSARIGLSLWQHTAMALIVESLIAVAGLAIYLRGSDVNRGRKAGLAAFVLVLILLTIAGQLSPTPPEHAAPVAMVSLTLIAAMAVVAWLLSRSRTRPTAA